MKKGIIDISQLKIPPEKHELETARYFSEQGKDIVFIAPSNIPSIHMPDIRMDGIEWEIKCPAGKSKRTIENNFRKAVKQSENIIFDLRRIKVSEDQCIAQIEREFNLSQHVRKLLVIMKNLKLLSFSK